MNEVRVYVPTGEIIISPTGRTFPPPPSMTSVVLGAAIVGRPHETRDGEHRVEIYFEGNVYNHDGMKEFEQMLFHAADRMLANYPTMARRWVPPEDLIPVGWWNHELRRLWLDGPEEEELLENWKSLHWSRQPDAEHTWAKMMEMRWGVREHARKAAGTEGIGY